MKLHHREPGGVPRCRPQCWHRHFAMEPDWEKVTCGMCLRLKPSPLCATAGLV